MSRSRSVSLLVGVAALALSGAACKQGAGDRCEIDTDCNDGLLCLNGTGSTNTEGGRCGSNPTGLPPVDASVGDTGAADTEPPDSAPDQAPGTDGGMDALDDTAGSDASDAMDDGAPADAAGSDAPVD